MASHAPFHRGQCDYYDFLIIVAVQVIKLIIDLVDFLAKVLGGIFTKVVRLFL